MRVRWSAFLGILVLTFANGLLVPGASAHGTNHTTTTSITTVTYNRSCEKSHSFQTQIDLDRCEQREFTEVSGQLRSELAVEARQFGAATVAAIQNQWLSYMEANCNAFAGAVGGTEHPMFVGECQVALTVDRLIEVRQSLTFNPIGR